MCWVNKNMKNKQFKLKEKVKKRKEKKRNRKTPFTLLANHPPCRRSKIQVKPYKCPPPLSCSGSDLTASWVFEFEQHAAAHLVCCRGTGASGFWDLGLRHRAAAQLFGCRGSDLSDFDNFQVSASCRGSGLLPAAAVASLTSPFKT